MAIRTTQRVCKGCGSGFNAYEVEWNGVEVFRQECCEGCMDVAQKAAEGADRARREKRQVKAREELFQQVCPPLYQDTDPSRVHSKFRDAVMRWRYGPRGLGLVGVAGTGKTRAAYMLLKRMVAEGRRVEAINATEFSRFCVDQFADDRRLRRVAERRLRFVYQADVWLLDDLGKQRMTERAEVELYSALEYRSSWTLPIVWTANARSDLLFRMFSEDRAEPIMRRLTEFNHIVDVWCV